MKARRHKNRILKSYIAFTTHALRDAIIISNETLKMSPACCNTRRKLLYLYFERRGSMRATVFIVGTGTA